MSALAISMKERCEAVMQKGDYLFEHFGREVNADSLLNGFSEIDLKDPDVAPYVTGTRALRFTNYYYMLRDMSHGASFDEARDGVAISPLYPVKPLNEYDYAKLIEVFSDSLMPSAVHTAYLSRIPFLLRTYGYPEQLAQLPSLISHNVEPYVIRDKALEAFDAYDHLREGREAPPIVTDTQEDLLYSPSESGKMTVIDVWASWCHSCLKKMPVFIEIARDIEVEHPGRVRFVALSIDSDSEAWRKAESRNGIDSIASYRACDKGEDCFERIYHVDGVPRYIIIGADGRFIRSFAPSPGDDLKRIIIENLPL